jgi:hypothetical protein
MTEQVILWADRGVDEAEVDTGCDVFGG